MIMLEAPFDATEGMSSRPGGTPTPRTWELQFDMKKEELFQLLGPRKRQATARSCGPLPPAYVNVEFWDSN